MKTSKQISLVHPGYAEYAYRWDYYMRSYMGAEEYRDGAYLRKYIAEDQSPGDQYQQRLLDTALQNHVRQTVDAYRSFLFRNPPSRTLGQLAEDPFVRDFIENADLDNTTLNDFMREVNDMVTIYGGAWVGVDRPSYQVETVAQEIEEGIRAYLTLYAPTNVRNWSYSRKVNGQKVLDMVQIVDEQYHDHDVIRVFHPEVIEVYKVAKGRSEYSGSALSVTASIKDTLNIDYGEILEYNEYANPLGYVPFVHVQTDRSFHKGIGTSAVGDVCDLQREIYNLTSELYQTIRISSAPSIVAEPAAEINGGAGAIITIPETTTNTPYLLQPTGASVDGILKSIEQKVDAIDDLTHLTAIKAKKGAQSGVSLQVEKEMLNAKLADTAGVLESTEKKIWKMWFDWQGITPDEDFYISYEKKFDLRDKHQELSLFDKALKTVPNEKFQTYINQEIARLMISDETDLQEILNSIDPRAELNLDMPHPPMTNVEDMVMHIRKMIEEGYSDEQMIELHPEMRAFFDKGEPAQEVEENGDPEMDNQE